MAVAASSVWPVAVDATQVPSRVPVTWVVRTLKADSSARTRELVHVASKGQLTWSASGACRVAGDRVVTNRPGRCTLTLTIPRAPGRPATSATRSIPVMKETTVNVVAAASLSGVFDRIATAFSRERRHVKVVSSFAGSATLVTQIMQGAPFDVVALADRSSMDTLVTAGMVNSSSIKIFALNRLAILVPKGNPLRIRTIFDLANPGIGVSLCDEAQPCGKYAKQMFAAAGLTVTPVTRETSASGVVGRVAHGEADAGVAYASDGFATGGVTTVAIPAARNVIARYPVATAAASSAAGEAAQFTSFLLSASGRSLLASAGFIAP